RNRRGRAGRRDRWTRHGRRHTDTGLVATTRISGREHVHTQRTDQPGNQKTTGHNKFHRATSHARPRMVQLGVAPPDAEIGRRLDPARIGFVLVTSLFGAQTGTPLEVRPWLPIPEWGLSVHADRLSAGQRSRGATATPVN